MLAATSVTLAAIFGFGMMGLFFRRKAFEKGRLMLMVLPDDCRRRAGGQHYSVQHDNLDRRSRADYAAGSYPVTITADEVGVVVCLEPGGAGRQLHRSRERSDIQ